MDIFLTQQMCHNSVVIGERKGSEALNDQMVVTHTHTKPVSWNSDFLCHFFPILQQPPSVWNTLTTRVLLEPWHSAIGEEHN